MFGYDPDLVVTREHAQAVIHPDDRAPVQAVIAKTISTKGQGSVEYRAVLPNGQTRWMQGWGRFHEGFSDGRPRLLGITLDVTERKQMELQLNVHGAGHRPRR